MILMAELTAFDLNALLEFEIERTQKINAICQRMLYNSDLVIERLQRMKGLLNDEVLAYPDELMGDDFNKEIGTYDAKFLGDLNALIEDFTSFASQNFELLPDEISSEIKRKFDKEILGVEVKYFEGKIVAFLPVLPPRGDKFVFSNTTKRYYPKAPFGHPYYDSVARKMPACFSSIPIEELKKFKKKLVSFFFVYHTDTKDIPDSDRHDTKTITDAITGWLPGGDAAASCSFFQKTLLTDDVPAGTFVVVSPVSYEANVSAFDLLKSFSRAVLQN